MPTVTCTDNSAEAKRTALERAQALVTAEGGDKAVVMEKLIARVQLQAGMDKASVINMPLADFVAAAMGRSVGHEDSTRAIAELPDLSPVQDAIYRALTSEYQSAADIAKTAHCDERQARRELPNLKRLGLVDHKQRVGYRRAPSNARALRA
jgi:hypothetical protein